MIAERLQFHADPHFFLDDPELGEYHDGIPYHLSTAQLLDRFGMLYEHPTDTATFLDRSAAQMIPLDKYKLRFKMLLLAYHHGERGRW